MPLYDKFVYVPSEEELVEISNEIRLKAAGLSQIDPELLRVEVKSCEAIRYSPQDFLWRVVSADLLLTDFTFWEHPPKKVSDIFSVLLRLTYRPIIEAHVGCKLVER